MQQSKRLPVLCVFGIVPDVNGSTLFRKVDLPRTVNLNKHRSKLKFRLIFLCVALATYL